MAGGTDLAVLLRSIRPVVRAGEYVFVTAPHDVPRIDPPPVCTFHEDEGLTLIVERTAADAAGLAYGPAFRCVTLSVHSSLEAVGLLAAVTGALAARGISVNAVSAYYHDHLFVPAARVDAALAVLQALAAG